MRELSTEELAVVSGGSTLTFGHALGSIPPLQFTFENTGGMLSYNGMTVPIGVGHPVIHFP